LEASPDSDCPHEVLLAHAKPLALALGFRDGSTQLHSQRVMLLAEALGMWCGLSGGEMRTLRLAAAFHDIGKIGIPDSILNKASALDAAEWAVMKRHSEMGAQIIASVPLEHAAEVAMVIRQHHEYYNGKGYPEGRAGAEILICARNISISDSYDAMAEPRAYHRVRSHTAIMDTLALESGVKHDPALMRVFSERIGTSPLRANMG
jgi:HD-GYP domain-containing protein (c-di-GMP phosphodiesterase class II)